jgi:creatinine amidohydrolase
VSKFKLILASVLLAIPSLFAQAKPPLVDFTLMTWPEVKQALAGGKTTALILNGGIEQRGPQGVNGAHTLIVQRLGIGIAEKLGNAIVAPVNGFRILCFWAITAVDRRNSTRWRKN